jgi:hypothetical protein
MNSTRRIRILFVAVAVASAVGSLALAQSATLKAPTAADWTALAKLPDFTGVWETGGGGGAPQRGAARAGGAPPADAGAGAGNRGAGAPPPAAARRGGAGAAAGRGGGPSLTPEYAAKRTALLANPPEDSQAANCLPPGMPGIMGQPYPMEFLLTPGQVTILIEAYNQTRHIYTDGRKLPEEPDPTFYGTSVGRWEGDTLVVDTVGFSPITQIVNGVPHSDKMRILERFRLADPDTMTIDTTITDPEALTMPFTSSRTLRRHRDWTLAEYICEENNRNSVDQNGKARINLAPPKQK